MIVYDAGIFVAISSRSSLRALGLQPVFQLALLISFVGAAIALILGIFTDEIGLKGKFGGETALFAGFTGVMGFIFVFRLSHSYGRFQVGADLVFEMCADFFDAASILFALARRKSKDDQAAFKDFSQTLMRLVSLLSAVCFAGLSGNDGVGGDSEEDLLVFLESIGPSVIDLTGLDDHTLRALGESSCKPELAYQLLQNLIVDHMDTVLDVPPPILTRVFQELGNGMVKYHEAFKTIHIPYPFPLMALAEMALLMHCVMCPIIFSFWCDGPIGAATFTFLVEFILWSMVGFASEFDFPFGRDLNDLDLSSVQKHLNHGLVSLVQHVESPCPTVCQRSERVSQSNYLMAPRRAAVSIRANSFGQKSSIPTGREFAGLVRSITGSSLSSISEPRACSSIPRASMSGIATLDLAMEENSSLHEKLGAPRRGSDCEHPHVDTGEFEESVAITGIKPPRPSSLSPGDRHVPAHTTSHLIICQRPGELHLQEVGLAESDIDLTTI